MSSDRTEIQSLMARWRKKNGHPMPIEIARLPIEKIRKAVRLTEAGTVVCVPPGLSLGEARTPIDMTDDSLMDWDYHKEH
jgi:hypothetical protein